MTQPSITIKAATPVPSVSSPATAPVVDQQVKSALADTPSLKAILSAFERDGNGDTELLKSILKAKEQEDAVSYTHKHITPHLLDVFPVF